MKPLVPDGVDHLSERVVQAVHLDDRADSGRVDHLPAFGESSRILRFMDTALQPRRRKLQRGNDTTTINYRHAPHGARRSRRDTVLHPWFSFAARAWAHANRTPPGRSVALLLMVANSLFLSLFLAHVFLPSGFPSVSPRLSEFVSRRAQRIYCREFLGASGSDDHWHGLIGNHCFRIDM